jgi:uncharacterized membrane protein YkgB
MSAEFQSSREVRSRVSKYLADLPLAQVVSRVEAVGRLAIRYGLVVVLAYIGGMKFTAYEAEGISLFVSNSPFMAWTYQLLSVRGLSSLIGFTEIVIAALIAARPWSPTFSSLGSVMAVGMFLTTLSFLFTTPGVIEGSLGFPALSVLPGQFLLKDVVLLGAALWTLGDSLQAIVSRQQVRSH